MSKLGSTSQVVVVHPKLFDFYADDPNSYKQVATLYNPNEFAIKFKVLSTAPKKFTVTEPERFLNPKACIELTIKHQASAFSLNENVSDKLRIQIYQALDNNSTSKSLNLISKIDIPLHSIASREKYMMHMLTSSTLGGGNSMNDSMYEEATRYSAFTHGNSLNEYYTNQTGLGAANSVNSKKMAASVKQAMMNNPMMQNSENVSYLVILVGAICLGILFLPLIGTTTESMLPKYVHVNYEIKLFASFVLGMVTMVILKTS